eukprot:2122805-Alexandrium_andersonii.AAC.1
MHMKNEWTVMYSGLASWVKRWPFSIARRHRLPGPSGHAHRLRAETGLRQQTANGAHDPPRCAIQ